MASAFARTQCIPFGTVLPIARCPKTAFDMPACRHWTLPWPSKDGDRVNPMPMVYDRVLWCHSGLTRYIQILYYYYAYIFGSWFIREQKARISK